MKKFYFILAAFSVFSCQNEESTVNQDNRSALTKASPLALLVSRVSQNPTHCDNILDHSDCYSVRLPVDITVNGDDFSIEDEDDFDDVRENMEENWSDDDIVHFNFPITIVYRDHSEQIIASQSQLDAANCGGGDDFNEIRCLDFVFPISINVYDTNNQIANTVTIDDNIGLYNFIHDIAATDIFTIVYPVTMTLQAGGAVTVNSNNELEETIEDAIDDCDNDSGPGQQPTELEEIMTSGTWYISFCEGGNYDGYVFTFFANGSVTAVKNSMTGNGTWEVYQDGSHEMLDLFFPSQQLQGLTDDEWKVTEFNATNFRLKKDHGSGDGNEYVYFTKN